MPDPTLDFARQVVDQIDDALDHLDTGLDEKGYRGWLEVGAARRRLTSARSRMQATFPGAISHRPGTPERDTSTNSPTNQTGEPNP